MKARQVVPVKQTKGKTTNDDKKSKTWQIILFVIEFFFYFRFVFFFFNLLDNLLEGIRLNGKFVFLNGYDLFTNETTRTKIITELNENRLKYLANTITKNTITVGKSVNYFIERTSLLLGDLAIALIARKMRCSYKSAGDKSGLQSTGNRPGQWTCF